MAIHNDKLYVEIRENHKKYAFETIINLNHFEFNSVGFTYQVNNRLFRIYLFINGRLDYTGEGIFKTDTDLYLAKVCYLTKEEHLYNINTPSSTDHQAEIEDLVYGMTKSYQPIWRPDTNYAIQLEVEDEVSYQGNIVNNETSYINFGFQTKGPVGHFHEHSQKYQQLKNQDKADEFPLKDLQHYIDFNRSYPRADGILKNTKPLYYKDPRILLFFNQPYVNAMFNTWEPYNGLNQINPQLKLDVLNPQNQEVDLTPSWKLKDVSYGQEDARILNNLMVNGDNCAGVIGPFHEFLLHAEYDIPDLQPEKLYTAVFNADYQNSKQQVHKFPFQTSRYQDFQTHLMSYELGTENGTTYKAIYTHYIDPHDLNKAQQLIKGNLSNNDQSLRDYPHKFDRLMDGFLKPGSIEAAEATEFNIMIDQNSGNIIGIWVRTPEPLAVPSLPDNIKNDVLSFDNAADSDSYTTLYAKDMKALFVTNDSLNIPKGVLTFTYKYHEYDGVNYNVIDTVNIAFDLNNFV